MPKNIIFLCGFFLLVTSICQGQEAKITGRVLDSSIQSPLQNASVVLLQAKDSFIIADTRADQHGQFHFNHLNDSAAYVLFFTYPKFVDYAFTVDMKKAPNGLFDLGKVNLMLKEKLLQEVIVKSQLGAIRIKGDTTEYAADSFKVQANATVEDLLKQLPGLQVDQYGNITAQGKTVKKVLVDGEEFFSDDPTLVTRNLRADMIDKVQVYDKKSDAASFTGIEDGVRDKTINLKIKEDKNNGIFGKTELGAGTQKHYNAQGMFNAFKGKRKMAAYISSSNIGRSGLGSADKQRLGLEEGGDGNYDGRGLPQISSGGLHFDNKWKKDKNSINGNYNFNTTQIEKAEFTTQQNNLPTGIIRSNWDNISTNHSSNQSLNGRYQFKPDTTTTFRLYTDGGWYTNRNNNTSTYQNSREDGSRINDRKGSGENTYGSYSYNLNASWEKKLKKQGRTLSLYLNNNFSGDHSTGESRSTTQFYTANNLLDSSGVLNLRKTMQDNWRTTSLYAIYTEPLFKKLSLIVNYTALNEAVHDKKQSFNLVSQPSASIMDTSFSTVVDASKWAHEGGFTLNYAFQKIIAKMSQSVKDLRLEVTDLLRQHQLQKNYLIWNPKASFEYKFNQYRSFNFSYQGNSNNPERYQLLPNHYNNAQLVVYLPNIQLKNSFSNNLEASYYEYKIMSSTYYGGSVNYWKTINPIVESSQVSAEGISTYQYQNMKGYQNSQYNLSGYYSTKFTQWEIQAGGYFNVTGGEMFSRINNEVNQLHYITYLLGVQAFKTKLKQHEVFLNGNGSYTQNKSSLQPGQKNNYFAYTLSPSANIYFLKKFQLHTDINYSWQQKSQTFNQNYQRTIWNAWLGRQFLKNDQLLVKISCNDILNENNGYSRSATNTVFTESRYNTIRRFFMVGATWSFTQFNQLKP